MSVTRRRCQMGDPVKIGRAWLREAAILLSVALAAGPAGGRSFTIQTTGGRVEIEVSHVGPNGGLVSPGAPVVPGFRPPTIFSAPLPTGSGARALGFSGAFTAVADDATAASWNPAGLVQLEHPEASLVYRFSRKRQHHHSDDAAYTVGADTFSSYGLNYASAVYPFFIGNQYFVFSANYQEAYDFTQEFTANMTDTGSSTQPSTVDATYRETVTAHYEQDSEVFPNGITRVDVTSDLTTQVKSTFRELLASDTLTDLAFEQEGGIDAISPALAMRVTPRLFVGAAVNFYRDNPFAGGSVRSHTRARYAGSSVNNVLAGDTRTTTGTYTYRGKVHVPAGGSSPFPWELDIEGAGTLTPFTEATSRRSTGAVSFDGVYEEWNEYNGFSGCNATLGGMWTVSRHLSLGFGLDLPWTAEARQTKTTRNTVTSYDATGSRVLDVSASQSTLAKDIEFDFPLYWAVGAVWRWNDHLYTTMDISETLWSDFTFQAEGEDKLNPLDGSPVSAGSVDDCWAVRMGMEYLWKLTHTDVPLRCGVSWEQRPAVDRPDSYWGASLGTGIALGRRPGCFLFDVAYMISYGDDVLESLVPDQSGLSSDVTEHQGYISCICHF